MSQPLCGQKWLTKHKEDHTQAEIDALGIEIFYNDKRIANIGNHGRGGKVKAITKFKRRQER